MDALPALAEMVEAGATVEGDDRNSVLAAIIAAVDLAGEAEELPFAAAREVRLRFDDNGDVMVTVVDDGGAETAATVAASDLQRFFSEAEGAEETERPSMPPPAPGT